jgi:hypothetical protein
LIHVTRDGGNTWKDITGALPEDLWVSSIQASKFETGRVYTSLNGYRWDKFDSYVYMSNDFGEHWERIAMDLPMEPVNVVREDPINQDILYIGTDQGLYISLDRGKHVMSMGDMPSVAVHDLVIHPRDMEIVVATHGRSFYKANVKHVQQMKALIEETLSCFNETIKSRTSSRWGERSADWMEYNDPFVSFPIYTLTSGDATLKVYADSLLLHTEPLFLNRGLGYYKYHLELNEEASSPLLQWIKSKDEKSKAEIKKRDNGKFYLTAGKYRMVIAKDGEECELKLELK